VTKGKERGKRARERARKEGKGSEERGAKSHLKSEIVVTSPVTMKVVTGFPSCDLNLVGNVSLELFPPSFHKWWSAKVPSG
jgi:hypothetical protein